MMDGWALSSFSSNTILPHIFQFLNLLITVKCSDGKDWIRIINIDYALKTMKWKIMQRVKGIKQKFYA